MFKSSLSKELQSGKAGEHLVCFDLIMQGYSAFLADQGLPYDVIVDKNGVLLKIQVKSTKKLVNYEKSKNIYRFGTRRAKKSKRLLKCGEVDYFAFVALDIMKIAYIHSKDMVTSSGYIKQTIDFKTKSINYIGRKYNNGTIRNLEYGRFIENYGEF